MVVQVEVKLKNDQDRFVTGETVAGTAEVTVPSNFKSENIKLSFHCLGETKWPESHANPSMDHTGYVSYDKYEYLNVELPFKEADVFTKQQGADAKKLLIPFSYPLAKDVRLPSTMISNHGFVQYYIQVTVNLDSELKTYTKEVIVRAPIEKHLLTAVVGSTSKLVVLHQGTVSLTASIPRKGYAPGEKIPVYLDINNQSNAQVVPRVSLKQVQIFMCGTAHKTVETTFNEKPIIGAAVGPSTDLEEMLEIAVPEDEALTITSSVVSVKYFIHVTLDIPNSFDLHVNLPVIMTTKEVIEALQSPTSPKKVLQASK